MAHDEIPLEAPRPLSATVSLSMKINLGNYESAEAFMSVSGVTEETTTEEIDALLAGGARIAYEELKEHLAGRIAALRRKE